MRPGNVSTSSIDVTVANASSPSLTGQWSAPFELGIVAVNMVLMHTGKVLIFSGSFATSGIERVWDPMHNAITYSAESLLQPVLRRARADGRRPRSRRRAATIPNSVGIRRGQHLQSGESDLDSDSEHGVSTLVPSVTTLPDGRMLATSGGQTCLTCLADLPEVYDPRTNRWTTLTSARLAVPSYPLTFLLPDGRVLNAGSTEQAVATSALNLSSRTWSAVEVLLTVDGHTAVMYRPGHVLKTGTAADSGYTGNAATTAYVMDATQPSPAWRSVPSMAFRRAFQNMTILPDGNVLVTGGGTRRDGYDIAYAVREAELWDPSTEAWRTLARARHPRLYHSSALLLPDGRVLIAGGGNDYGVQVNYTEGEIFSPPYLFRGARPSITSAPSAALQYRGNRRTIDA